MNPYMVWKIMIFTGMSLHDDHDSGSPLYVALDIPADTLMAMVQIRKPRLTTGVFNGGNNLPNVVWRI